MDKLNGFIELPVGENRIVYIRLDSIDAVGFYKKNTFIALRGCPDSEDMFTTSLELKEVIALMVKAQNG